VGSIPTTPKILGSSVRQVGRAASESGDSGRL